MRWRLAFFTSAAAFACWLCAAEQFHKTADLGMVRTKFDADTLNGSAEDVSFLAAASDFVGTWHSGINPGVLVSYRSAFGKVLPGIRRQLGDKGCLDTGPCAQEKVNAGIVQIWSDLLLVSREDNQITPVLIQNRVRDSGYVMIWSEPKGATFEFKEADGTWKDSTDKEAYKAIGTHKLKITMDGYTDWEQDCNIPSMGGVGCGTRLVPKTR